MCYDANISLSTFILGTVANVGTAWYFRKKPMIMALCVFWESILLIQLWEYLMWKNPFIDNQCNATNQFATKAAFMTHMVQPVVLFVSLACLPEIDAKKKMVGAGMLMIYLTYMIFSFAGKRLNHCTGCEKDRCESLVHEWWKVGVSPVPYVLIFGALFMVMVRPLSLAATQIFWAYLTFAIALTTWKNPQQFSSRWCFFAALAPLFMGITAKLVYKNDPLFIQKKQHKNSEKLK